LRNALRLWFDYRTGADAIRRSLLLEPLPGGALWRTVFGPALAGTFLVQLFTGLLLMSSYVPSASQAWGSVWFIENQMTFGWFIRGLHHWGSSAMMILLALHLVQVVFTAAYRAPREVNWWLGLGLMLCVLGLALTGYLLPWDQKGFWAAKVATNIAGGAPLFGPYIQQLIVGGTEYGNQTLTRLYGIHVGLLPLCLLALLVLHVLLRYRHGRTGPEGTDRTEPAWPGQVFRNVFAWSVVLGILVAWTWREHGVGLEAPADPASTDYPARPEWYFLPLYQMLNEVPPKYEAIATMVIPGGIVAFLALLPLLDRALPRTLVRGAACLFLLALLGGSGYLMFKAVSADLRNPDFQANRAKADVDRDRASLLASTFGVPPDGAGYLLRRDPKTQGVALLEQKCLSCHAMGGRGHLTRARHELTDKDLADATPVAALGSVPEPVRRALSAKLPEFAGTAEPKTADDTSNAGKVVVLHARTEKGEDVTLRIAPDGSRIDQETRSPQTAADLRDYGSSSWVRDLLDDPKSSRFFGKVPQCGGMNRWKAKSKLTAAQLDTIADFFETHLMTVPEDLPASEWAEREDVQAHPGFKHFQEGGECATCHGEWVYPNEEAPNLYGWGSPWWIRRMIERPDSKHMYGYLDSGEQMPGFREQFASGDLETLIRYLKNDYLGAEPARPASGHGQHVRPDSLAPRD
jgi:ubiquinol-cytochrome c reductase cytochrome b subunit